MVKVTLCQSGLIAGAIIRVKWVEWTLMLPHSSIIHSEGIELRSIRNTYFQKNSRNYESYRVWGLILVHLLSLYLKGKNWKRSTYTIKNNIKFTNGHFLKWDSEANEKWRKRRDFRREYIDLCKKFWIGTSVKWHVTEWKTISMSPISLDPIFVYLKVWTVQFNLFSA